MAQTSMTVRLDSQQKAIFDEVCSHSGMNAKAHIAFQNMCNTAKENHIKMSPDKINAEIKEVRRSRMSAMVYAIITTMVIP